MTVLFPPIKGKEQMEKKNQKPQTVLCYFLWISISAVRKQNLRFNLDQVPELFIKVKEEHKPRGAAMQLLTVNQSLG